MASPPFFLLPLLTSLFLTPSSIPPYRQASQKIISEVYDEMAQHGTRHSTRLLPRAAATALPDAAGDWDSSFPELPPPPHYDPKDAL